MRPSASFIAGLILTLSAQPSWGQCPETVDELLTFPDSGDAGVPTNVVPRVELPMAMSMLDVLDWSVSDDDGQDVEGEVYWDGLTTTFTPDHELEPRTQYSCSVIIGYDSYANFSFTTGDGTDDRRPRFQGVTSIEWEYRTADWLQSNCSLYRGGGHLFTLNLAEVNDETDHHDLCYHVYRSAGPDLTGPRLEARTRADDTIRVFVPEGAGDGHYCFHVEVEDLAGRFDTNSSEVCMDVIANALFGNICSVTAPAPRSSPGGLLLAACLVLGIVLRRWRRKGV